MQSGNVSRQHRIVSRGMTDKRRKKKKATAVTDLQKSFKAVIIIMHLI